MANSLQVASLDDAASSLTAKFIGELRNQILSGRKPPNSRLNLTDLKEEFGVSLSPIREGLAHLTAEGFVIPTGLRGYRVAPVSIAQMKEIMALRIDFELKGLRQSITNGNEAWEVAVITSYRRLRNFETTPWGERDAEKYEALNLNFHRALLSGCDSPILIRFADILGGMADRYRRVFLKVYAPDRDVPKEHADIFEACLDRNADRACVALEHHIAHTSENVLQLLLTSSDVELASTPVEITGSRRA